MRSKIRSTAFVLLSVVCSSRRPDAQSTAAKVTAPQQFFGHQIGADYVLPNYTKFTEYVRLLDKESDRMQVQSSARPPKAATSSWRSSRRPKTSRTSPATKRSRANCRSLKG